MNGSQCQDTSACKLWRIGNQLWAKRLYSSRDSLCAEKDCSRNGGLLSPRSCLSSFPIERMNESLGSITQVIVDAGTPCITLSVTVAERNKHVCALRTVCVWNKWRSELFACELQFASRGPRLPLALKQIAMCSHTQNSCGAVEHHVHNASVLKAEAWDMP